jgi:hypothetical protein
VEIVLTGVDGGGVAVASTALFPMLKGGGESTISASGGGLEVGGGLSTSSSGA